MAEPLPADIPAPARGRAPNARDPIAMPTYDGSKQCVHPDVIDGRATPFGRRYVMVMEPYPDGQAAYENPSIVVSDDAVHWMVPDGLVNPVVPARAGGGWHSDAAIAMRGAELLLYYRYNSGQGESSLLLRSSIDGIRWSAEETLLRFPVSGAFASPSVFEAQGQLAMVYVDTLGERLYLMMSDDGRHWGPPELLLAFPGAWHACARRVDGIVQLLINDGSRLHLVRCAAECGWRAYDGATWRAPHEAQALLEPSADGWDDALIYHGAQLQQRDILHLWYSAKSTRGEWRIGYTHVAV